MPSWSLNEPLCRRQPISHRHHPRDLGTTLAAPERTARRELLIALNTCLELGRDAVCRLALAVDRWAGPLGADERAKLVDELGVSRADLTVARRLVRRAGNVAGTELEQAERRSGARVVTFLDPEYPIDLLDLELPPPVLYVLGRIPQRPAVAIVGSRQADPYGLEAAELFGRELAHAGLTVVSGLARGVDSAAHRGALAAVDGRTVAVQARGIDGVYPKSNRKLAAEILEHGAMLSEFPLGAYPLPRNFPVRNRLIAALSVGTLVVQAARRSGSLITARLALELGRDVYAVPGPIFHKRAAGANELVRDGAVMALSPRDVLEALPLAVQDRLAASSSDRQATEPDTPEGIAATVLELLTDRAEMAPEAIAEEAGLDLGEVLTALLELELEGRVRRHPGPVFHIHRGDQPG